MSKVFLGDVATERKETFKGNKDGFPIVGLEHLIPKEISLTSWDKNSKNTFTKMFRKDNVLFGRRRAYLKKASVAPFDGICSGDIIVIEAKPDRILPALLPFIIQNDDLFDFAIGKSAGSLSPRVKWEHLKNYKFELPDMEKQHKLSKLLWTMENTRKSYQRLMTATDELMKAQFIEMFGDPIENPMGWITIPLLELGTCKNGMNYHSNDSGINIYCLGVSDFKDNSIISNAKELSLISLNEEPSSEYLLQDEDIVFVRSNGNKALVGRSVMVFPGNTPVTYSGFCIRFRKNSAKVEAGYLLRLFKIESVRTKMAGRGTSIQNLNQKILSELQIPLPPIELQLQYLKFVDQCEKSKSELKQTIESINTLIRSLIQQDFN